ncbi:MAG TPA: class I SAM-dependent methyltransferase [Solirubrobacterales bacterium]
MRALPLTPLAAAVLHVPAPERALAIGCGEGDAALFLAREFPAARIRGVDPSEELIHEAIEKVGLDPEGRVAFKAGGPRRLPYPDGFFDLAVGAAHDVDPSEAARVLRPGAHLIVAPARPPGLRGRLAFGLLRRRLLARGFSPLPLSDAEERNFLVARLAGPD